MGVLPKEHVTSKLESLPKGLRQQAERIIKKKFGLNSNVKPPKKESITTYDSLVRDPRELLYIPIPSTLGYLKNGLHVTVPDRIEYSWHSRCFYINFFCSHCERSEKTFRVNIEDAQCAASWTTEYDCQLCRTRTYLEVSNRQFKEAYESVIRTALY